MLQFGLPEQAEQGGAIDDLVVAETRGDVSASGQPRLREEAQ